ncbi:hypothetical protein JOF56_007164 [Kibdelosporangium banguiense]|uniref:Uncharacterized protein n=1 Tax=Kibdelosporangium banguiense TaxID=1365924 RepID=A0ABS4TQU4_9PSEU|nr:hypothetical protein [Kibdelosporangium banguiense]MBP2326779.1 hypothetical protein [Kibdelosporangium banguiense]
MGTGKRAPEITGMTDTDAAPRRLPHELLWVLLTLAVAANTGASLFSMSVAVGVVFGVVALGLAALLAYDHYRRRTRRSKHFLGVASESQMKSFVRKLEFHMGKNILFAAIAALGLTLSGAALAPAALAGPANEPAAEVMSGCQDDKRNARALLRELGRPTGSDDAVFLYNQMQWVWDNYPGAVRLRAQDIRRRMEANC